MIFEGEIQSYYEILDVKPDAGQNEIRQAYLRAKSAYSKDSAALYSLFDDRDTRHVLELVEQAYLVLSSPERRREYDRVHGFLRFSAEPLSTSAPASGPMHPQGGNTTAFSFSSGQLTTHTSGANPTTTAVADAAIEAAQTFLGPSSVPVSDPTPIARPHLDRPQHEDYSTPRTLAAHGAAGPPMQEYNNSLAFSATENRLGLVRRVDLSKPYEKIPSMEASIAAESLFRGPFLKSVREYKGITIDELSEFTKISRAYLNCIESEEFESLPAAAYLRGFVVQIAKAIKLPHEKVAAGYMSHYRTIVKPQ